MVNPKPFQNVISVSESLESFISYKSATALVYKDLGQKKSPKAWHLYKASLISKNIESGQVKYANL